MFGSIFSQPYYFTESFLVKPFTTSFFWLFVFDKITLLSRNFIPGNSRIFHFLSTSACCLFLSNYYKLITLRWIFLFQIIVFKISLFLFSNHKLIKLLSLFIREYGSTLYVGLMETFQTLIQSLRGLTHPFFPLCFFFFSWGWDRLVRIWKAWWKNKCSEFTPYSVGHRSMIFHFSTLLQSSFKHSTWTLSQPLFKSPFSVALTGYQAKKPLLHSAPPLQCVLLWFKKWVFGINYS